MQFSFMNWRERKQQTFDKENIVLHKKGKTFNVYDWIQENREDTEIEPTLKKYGCIPTEMLNKQGVYDNFTIYGDLRGVQEQMKMAKNMFYSLPLETRQKFNNNIDTFVKEGQAYVKGLIDAEIAEQKKQEELNKPKEQVVTVPANSGVTNNG